MNRVVHTLMRLPQRGLVGAVKVYRLFISPSLGVSCRFTPSCSAYCIEALVQHGAAAGSYLTLRRLAHCHPWCEGGHDPVPPLPSISLFSRLIKPLASNFSKKTPS